MDASTAIQHVLSVRSAKNMKNGGLKNMVNNSAEEKAPIEVEIRSERIIPIFRGELPQQHQIAVTYQPAGVPIPRTIWILAEDVFHAETETFLAEHELKEGSLYERWLEFRSAKIREDIEKQRVFKPERVSV